MNLPLKIVAFLAMAAIIVLAAKSILKERETHQVPPKEYTVRRMSIEQSVYGSGVLRCSRRAEIVSRAAGRIPAEQMFVQEGDTVTLSQELCRIANEELENQLAYAENEHILAQLDYTDAQQEYEDKKKLHELHKSPSEVELQRFERELRRKKQALDKAEEAMTGLKEKVGFLKVKSPLEGKVLKTHLKRSDLSLDPERVYPEGTPLFVVGDLTSLAVYGTILETDRDRVREADAAVVQAGKAGSIPAKVTRLSLVPSAASEGGRYDVQLDFDTPPSGMNEGLTVDFRIIVEKKNNVLAVPVEYVEMQEGRYWVKQVVGNVAKRVQIEVGISSYSFYEVTRGLKEGDTIQWDAQSKQ